LKRDTRSSSIVLLCCPIRPIPEADSTTRLQPPFLLNLLFGPYRLSLLTIKYKAHKQHLLLALAAPFHTNMAATITQFTPPASCSTPWFGTRPGATGYALLNGVKCSRNAIFDDEDCSPPTASAYPGCPFNWSGGLTKSSTIACCPKSVSSHFRTACKLTLLFAVAFPSRKWTMCASPDSPDLSSKWCFATQTPLRRLSCTRSSLVILLSSLRM
jgi:hypothetical protein